MIPKQYVQVIILMRVQFTVRVIFENYFKITRPFRRMLFERIIKYHEYCKFLILRKKKDGDRYIYPYFLAHCNVHKNVQKLHKIFKPRLLNVLRTGTNVIKISLSLCLMDCVRFARHCGKMYSRHLFSYGDLLAVPHIDD